MTVNLAYIPETQNYKINDRWELPTSDAIDVARRILRHAGAGQEPEPQPQQKSFTPASPQSSGGVLYTAPSILNHFRPQLINVDMDVQNTFQGLIAYKVQNRGATPSRRNLAAFMHPHLARVESDTEEQAKDKEKKIDNRSRNFTSHFDRLEQAGVGRYKKNRNKKGRDTFTLVGEVWGVSGSKVGSWLDDGGEALELWPSEVKRLVK